MIRKRYSADQIIGYLREAGFCWLRRTIPQGCRKIDIYVKQDIGRHPVPIDSPFKSDYNSSPILFRKVKNLAKCGTIAG
jgi:hypothetical protein